MLRRTLLPLLLLSAAALADDRTAKNVPALPKAVKLDGNMKDLAQGVVLKPIDADQATAFFSAKVGYRKDTLYVGIEITDDKLLTGDIVTLMMFFPDAGTTARGYQFRFAPDGMRTSDPDSMTPAYAQKEVQANVVRGEKGMTIKAAIPITAFPRFPAVDPMVMDLCVDYEDRDELAASPTKISNCSGASMAEPLKLPDSFRAQLKLKPPPNVVGIERMHTGWVGYAVLHQPAWIYADQKVTVEILQELFADEYVDAAKARVNLPADLEVGGEPLVGILIGKDPYVSEGKCDADHELRLLLYRAHGREAIRVLDWPASTCPLGRATSISMDREGNDQLTIGYTNGSVVTFTWAKDHFERTEIGMLQR